MAGLQEGREPTSLFDSAWYLRMYPDVQHAHLSAVEQPAAFADLLAGFFESQSR